MSPGESSKAVTSKAPPQKRPIGRPVAARARTSPPRARRGGQWPALAISIRPEREARPQTRVAKCEAVVLSQNSRFACSIRTLIGGDVPMRVRTMALSPAISIEAATPFPETSPSRKKRSPEPPSAGRRSQ